jgi:LysM repeat protein
VAPERSATVRARIGLSAVGRGREAEETDRAREEQYAPPGAGAADRHAASIRKPGRIRAAAGAAAGGTNAHGMPPPRAARPGSLALAALVSAALAPAASAHIVLPGESFWSIATANGVSPYALAAANGLSISSTILPGQSLAVPAPTYPRYGSTGAAAGASGMVPVPGPAGTAYLAPGAAQNLAALRAASMRRLGVDVAPAGPLSGYRSYAQQAELYRQFLAGTGPRAAPPGLSAHETGRALDLATPAGRQAVDVLGAPFGWRKTEAASEWWHVNYLGP